MKHDRLYIAHILECIHRIESYTRDGRDTLLNTPMAQDAAIRNFEVIGEAATYLGVHPETVKRLCQRGRIPAEKVHNTWLIQKEVVEKFAATYRNPRRANAGTLSGSLKQDRQR